MQKENTMKEADIVTTEEKGISNSKRKDSSSKIIFGNHELCAQFLKGYTEIPFLKDVQPEDIDDVTANLRAKRDREAFEVCERIRGR